MSTDASPGLSDNEKHLLASGGFCLDRTERDQYLKTGYKVGQGSFGIVWEAYRRPSRADMLFQQVRLPLIPPTRRSSEPPSCPLGNPTDATVEGRLFRVAIKEIDLTLCRDRQASLSDALQEADILRRVCGASHLLYSYTPWYSAEHDHLCFPMEKASMDLDHYTRVLKKYKLQEGYLLYIAYQMLCATEEMRDRALIHRDIKPENFLVFIMNDDSLPPRLKLTDFGLSVALGKVGGVRDVVGTPLFMAPECFLPFEEALRAHVHEPRQAQKSRSKPVTDYTAEVVQTVAHARDVWALGCSWFALANGVLPFRGGTRAEVFEKAAVGCEGLPKVPRQSETDNPLLSEERMVLHQLALLCLEPSTSRRSTIAGLKTAFRNALVGLPPPVTAYLQHVVDGKPRFGIAPGQPHISQFYQLMHVCRPEMEIPLYEEPPKKMSVMRGNRLGEIDGMGTPCGRIKTKFGVLVDFELDIALVLPPFDLNLGSPQKRLVGKSGLPVNPEGELRRVTQRWARIVYPSRGFIPIDQQGHHLLHRYQFLRRSLCPPLPPPLPLSTYWSQYRQREQHAYLPPPLPPTNIPVRIIKRNTICAGQVTKADPLPSPTLTSFSSREVVVHVDKGKLNDFASG